MRRTRSPDEHRPSTTPIAIMAGALVVGALVVITLLIVFIGGWKSVPPDKLLLHYTGGPFQGTHFKEEVDPGARTKFYGLLEHYYYLPSTQRNYIISKDPNAGEVRGVDFLSAPSNDNVLFTFEAATYFKLNTNPKTIRLFFEQICLHDHCTDLSPGGGWDKMLAQYFRPQIENTLRIEVEKYDRNAVYKDPNVLLAIQNAVGSDLKNKISKAIGGEFFCGPDATRTSCPNFSFVLKNPTPPENVVASYAQNAASQVDIQTAKNQAEATRQKAQGDADAQRERASAPPVPAAASEFIRAQALQACASNPQCHITFFEGSSPNSVIVNGGG